jgi:hypothetical protein
MLVSKYLEIINNEIDKEGMPYFEESDILNRLLTATYFFLEDNVPFIQTNQKAREDFSMLTVPFIQSTNSSQVSTEGLFALDATFYRLVSLTATYDTGIMPLPIVQSNDFQKLKDDPFHTPIKSEPLAEFYQNSVRVEPIPISVQGLHVKHPVFGVAASDELVTGLPIHIQLFLIEKVVLHLMTTIGDNRYQMQYYQVQNKNTDS